MKTNELRVGNWVVFNGVEQTVIGICDTDSGEPDACLSDGGNGCMGIHPIQITEEKLNGISVEIKTNRNEWMENEVLCENGRFYYIIESFSDEYGGWQHCEVEIKFIYQLQNLHYALTGEEI